MSSIQQDILPSTKGLEHDCIIGVYHEKENNSIIRESSILTKTYMGITSITFFPHCPLCCKSLRITPLVDYVEQIRFKVHKK